MHTDLDTPKPLATPGAHLSEIKLQNTEQFSDQLNPGEDGTIKN